ncbi:MAG: hypothetical protein WBF67_00925 [Olleya sp.]
MTEVGSFLRRIEIKEMKIKTTYYLVFSVILFNLSCKKEETSLVLKNHFNNEQIQDFKKINTFFISEALNNDKSNFKEEIIILEKNIYSSGIEILINKIDFQKQKDLYTSISKSSFNEIWDFCKLWKEKKRLESDTLKSICPKQEPNTNFKNYLRELGKNNPFAKQCFESIEASGDYSHMHFISSLLQNIDNIDFNKFDNQFIIAVYFLSLNDRAKRNEKWSEK